MPRNDEGEFEVVLGNRQLLGGFFIVVTLLAIFFSLGYIVGRHSAPEPMNAAAAGQDPVPVRPPSQAGPPPGQAEVVPAETKRDSPRETPEPTTGTKPATAPPETPRPAETGQSAPAASSSGAPQPAP